MGQGRSAARGHSPRPRGSGCANMGSRTGPAVAKSAAREPQRMPAGPARASSKVLSKRPPGLPSSSVSVLASSLETARSGRPSRLKSARRRHTACRPTAPATLPPRRTRRRAGAQVLTVPFLIGDGEVWPPVAVEVGCDDAERVGPDRDRRSAPSSAPNLAAGLSQQDPNVRRRLCDRQVGLPSSLKSADGILERAASRATG